MLVYAVAALWVSFTGPEDAVVHGRLFSGAPLIVFGGLILLWQARTPPVAAGLTWRAATAKLLAEQPWRETPAKVLNTRGTVLVFPGGEYVRVTIRLPAAVRQRFRAATVAAVLGTSLFVLGMVADGTWWSLLPAAAYLIVTVAILVRFRYLARLRPTGSWLQAEATAPSWQVRRSGLADGVVTLTFPDGRRCTAHLDRAPLPGRGDRPVR